MKKLDYRFLHSAAALMLLAAASSLAQSPPAANPNLPPAIAPGADPGPPPSPEQASYLFGLIFGTQMGAAGVTNQDVVADSVIRGMKDGLNGKQPDAAQQAQLRAFVRANAAAASAKNEAAAKEFLARNAHEKGVVTTASGLQYKIIAGGDKKAPAVATTDRVTVEYRGKLIDGSEFDSSYSRGMPAVLTLNGVIKGWQEALGLMKPGAKWQIFVPPALAYGNAPRPKIPPGSLLIFDINLLSAESAQGPPAAPPGTPR